MNANSITYNRSFLNWVWDSNKKHLCLVAGIALLAFVIYKGIYPFPNFSSESASYVDAAVAKSTIHIRPIGYSLFLRLTGILSHSHLLLVFIQYLALQIATVYFIFSICYLLKMEYLGRPFILVSQLFTPLFLYAANFITNEALFAAGNICWITTLLWLAYRPVKITLFTHGILLTLLLTIHNQAIYFPLISLAIVWLSKISKPNKWMSAGLIVLVPILFISFTQYQYSRRTGTVQFSPLNGWQLAGNALTAYTNVPAEERVSGATAISLMENTTNRFVDSLLRSSQLSFNELAQYYVWHYNSPLHKSMSGSHVSNDNRFRQWAVYGKFYRQFGWSLIKRYPIPYLKHFVIPNFANYYVPPTRLPGMYNPGMNNMELRDSENHFLSWFNINESDFTFHPAQDHWAGYYSILFSMINLLLLCCLLTIGITRKLDDEADTMKRAIHIIVFIWITSFLFSIFLTPLSLLNQVTPLITMSMFSIVMVCLIVRHSPQNLKLPIAN